MVYAMMPIGAIVIAPQRAATTQKEPPLPRDLTGRSSCSGLPILSPSDDHARDVAQRVTVRVLLEPVTEMVRVGDPIRPQLPTIQCALLVDPLLELLALARREVGSIVRAADGAVEEQVVDDDVGERCVDALRPGGAAAILRRTPPDRSACCRCRARGRTPRLRPRAPWRARCQRWRPHGGSAGTPG